MDIRTIVKSFPQNKWSKEYFCSVEIARCASCKQQPVRLYSLVVIVIKMNLKSENFEQFETRKSLDFCSGKLQCI